MSSGQQSELEQLRLTNEQLLYDLHIERELRLRTEEAKQQVDADRIKSQKARDELVRSMLLAERRAQEAEDEQLRAEQELTSLMQQMRASQQQPQQQPGPDFQPAVQQYGGDLAAALAELQRERQRAAQLEADAQRASQEAGALRQRLQEAVQQQHGAGLRRPAAGSSASLAAAEDSSGGSAGLMQRVAALKAARDKLIAALDTQAAEAERLSTENAALSEAVVELRDEAARWEAQAQLGLAQNERLKDLLEESATWDVGEAAAEAAAEARSPHGEERLGAAVEAAGAASPGSSAEQRAHQLEVLCGRLQRELLLEKSRTAQLDLQVRALCMELTRQAQRSAQMQHALVPVLGGVERRLAEVLGMRPKGSAAPAAAASAAEM